jgi:hypothetical protein
LEIFGRGNTIGCTIRSKAFVIRSMLDGLAARKQIAILGIGRTIIVLCMT